MCHTNFSGCLSLLGSRRLVRSEASSTADGARIDGGSGIWELTSRAPRTPSRFGCCRTTVAARSDTEMPFGAHSVAVIDGSDTALRESSSGELTDPLWRPGPDVSLCRSRSSRGTHSLLDSAVRKCGESRVAPVQRASFRHYGRPTSPKMTRALRIACLWQLGCDLRWRPFPGSSCDGDQEYHFDEACEEVLDRPRQVTTPDSHAPQGVIAGASGTT